MTHNIENYSEDNLSQEELSKREGLKALLLNSVTTPDDLETINEKGIQFKKNHPDSYEYLLYHELIGSTPPSSVTKFDTEKHEIENLIIAITSELQDRHKKAA